jgi:hypothetical protein
MQIGLFFTKARPRHITDISEIQTEEEKEKKKAIQAQFKSGWKSVIYDKWPWWWSVVAYVLSFIVSLFSGYLVILYLYFLFCFLT